MPPLIQVVPTDGWRLVLEFADEPPRLFDAAIARRERNAPELAYPNRLKSLAFDADHVWWPWGLALDARWLHERSVVASGDVLDRQAIRLGARNQAPTPEHATHHEYDVTLRPYRDRPFEVGESIGGGHAERGGSRAMNLAELRAWPDWKTHFALAHCAWAVDAVEAAVDERGLLRTLVREICRREAARDGAGGRAPASGHGAR